MTDPRLIQLMLWKQTHRCPFSHPTPLSASSLLSNGALLLCMFCSSEAFHTFSATYSVLPSSFAVVAPVPQSSSWTLRCWAGAPCCEYEVFSLTVLKHHCESVSEQVLCGCTWVKRGKKYSLERHKLVGCISQLDSLVEKGEIPVWWQWIWKYVFMCGRRTLIYLERVRNCKMNTMFLQKHIDTCVNALWETHDIYSMACCLCPLKIHRLSKNSRKSYESESNHISLVQSICSRSGIDLGWDQPLPDPTMLH